MIESVSDPYDRKARFAAGRGAVVNVEHAKAWSGSLKWQRLKAHLPLKKKARNKSGLWCSGGDREDRTPDLLIANQTLSQLSYAPIERCILQITVFLVKKEPRRQLVPTQAFQNAWLGGLSPTSAGFFLGIFSQAASAGKNRIAPSTFTRNMKASSKPISA